MAQLVERVLGKDEVGGSNPPSSSKKHPGFWLGCFFTVILGGFEGGSRFAAAKRFALRHFETGEFNGKGRR